MCAIDMISQAPSMEKGKRSEVLTCAMFPVGRCMAEDRGAATPFGTSGGIDVSSKGQVATVVGQGQSSETGDEPRKDHGLLSDFGRSRRRAKERDHGRGLWNAWAHRRRKAPTAIRSRRVSMAYRSWMEIVCFFIESVFTFPGNL